MKIRKRLLRRNQRLVQSSQEAHPSQEEASNLLESINNQKLYLKLVGITLSLSRQAGVSAESMNQLECKLLASKGFHEFPMLNTGMNNKLVSEHKKNKANKLKHYKKCRKFMEPMEQFAFVKEMERQVDEISAKEQLVLALKYYVGKQKKTTNIRIIKDQAPSRKKIFQQRLARNSYKKSINKASLYGKKITDVLSKINNPQDQSYSIVGKMIHLKTFWGHSFFQQPEQEYCPVYNTIFDNSQRLIITGGQDGLIKVWSRQSGLLISSLKGHSGFINKFCVSKCDKYLLSAAQDGVRFFNLQSMTAMGGMQLSYVFDIGEIENDKDPENSYIMFVDQERVYILEKKTMQLYKNRTLTTNDMKLFNFKHEIVGQGINMNTFLVNPNKFVFLGFTTGQVLIFNFNKLEKAVLASSYVQSLGPQIIMKYYPYKPHEFILPIVCVNKAHEDEIIEIKWNPIFSCYSTGSKKDGNCKIWDFKSDENFVPVVLNQLKIPKTKIKRKKKIYACNFLCWNCTYTHLVCSFMEESQEDENQYRGDGQVLVYSTYNFQITWEMSKSIELASITCIDTHPIYENIALICDHYGKLLLVDIFENFIINMFEERAYHLGHPSFCLVPSQCRFSQDGFSFIVATEYGNVSLYGYDIKDFYNVNPVEQFFETDYDHFEINPNSLNPVLSLDSDIDINQLSRGQLVNLRKQPYEIYSPIDIRDLLRPKISKIDHINCPSISQQSLLNTIESLRENQRSMQVYRQITQQIENKRLAILFQEREEREQKVKSFIQEKINQLKEHDQNLNQRIRGLPINQSLKEVQIPAIQTRNQGRGRRRGRNHLRNNPATNNIQAALNSEDELYQQSLNQQSEEYEAESQLQELDDEQDVDNFDDDDYDGNQSDPIYMHRNRSRRYQINNNRNQRRSQRNAGIRNRFGLYQVYDDDEPGVQTGVRRNRKMNEQIEQLLNQMESEPRKKNRIDDDDQIQQVYIKPRVRKLIIEDDQLNLQQCSLCKLEKICTRCTLCQNKKFCENCRPYRMKTNSLDELNQDDEKGGYMCLNCYFRENTKVENKKNVNHQKYIQTTRYDSKTRYSFVPQIDDQVAYFPEGYEEFVHQKLETLNNKVLKMKNIGFDEKTFEILPHDQRNYQFLCQVTKCVVKQIKFIYPLIEGNSVLAYSGSRRANRGSNQRNRSNSSPKENNQDILMFIRLEIADKEEATENLQFWVFYLPGQDFLLKWQIYDDIIKNDRYSKIQMYGMAEINGEQCQFMEIKPYYEFLYPKSIWKNIIVHKGESKNLRKSKQHNQILKVNIWSISDFVNEEAFEYKSNFPQQNQLKYVEEIKKLETKQPQAWAIFGYFVDISEFPKYYEFVEVGMCLNLILERLTNNYYKSQESFMKDMRHMTQNSISFNGQTGYITELCENIVNQVLFGNHFDKIQQKLQIEETEKKTKPKGRQSSNRSKKQQSPPQNYDSKKPIRVKVSPFNDNNESEEQYLSENQSNEEYEEGDDSENWNNYHKKKKLAKQGRKLKQSMEIDIKSRMKSSKIKKRINLIESDSQDFSDKINNTNKGAKAKRLQDEEQLQPHTRRRLRNQQRVSYNPTFQEHNVRHSRITRSKTKN